MLCTIPTVTRGPVTPEYKARTVRTIVETGFVTILAAAPVALCCIVVAVVELLLLAPEAFDDFAILLFVVLLLLQHFPPLPCFVDASLGALNPFFATRCLFLPIVFVCTHTFMLSKG